MWLDQVVPQLPQRLWLSWWYESGVVWSARLSIWFELSWIECLSRRVALQVDLPALYMAFHIASIAASKWMWDESLTDTGNNFHTIWRRHHCSKDRNTFSCWAFTTSEWLPHQDIDGVWNIWCVQIMGFHAPSRTRSLLPPCCLCWLPHVSLSPYCYTYFFKCETLGGLVWNVAWPIRPSTVSRLL